MWPLLVALTAMISPCTSSSANGSGVWGCRGGVPSFSSNSSSSCVDVPSSVGAWEPSSDVSWCSSGCARSVPSWDSCVCSGFVCLVAAKTEGEEMGQYVMAVYKQLGAAFARPITLRGVIIHGARSGCCRVASRGCVMFGGEQPGRGAAAQAPTPSLTRLSCMLHSSPLFCLSVFAGRSSYTNKSIGSKKLQTNSKRALLYQKTASLCYSLPHASYSAHP
jgi:hypothetical protein